MSITTRAFEPADTVAVNAVAVSAFEQYKEHYSDWPAFSKNLAKTAALANHSEFVVAEAGGQVIGAVAYIGPNKPKNSFFEQEWPIMRMLVVSPAVRGRGVGRMLAQECIHRALRDKAPVFALHTTPIMEIALSMYKRMGFTFYREAPSILGVPYGVYLKALGA